MSKFSFLHRRMAGRRVMVAFGSAWLLSSALPGFASAEKLLQEVDSVRAPGKNFSFDARLTYYAKNKKPVVQEFQVAVKDAIKSLVKFVAPSENRGRVLLMNGQNLWIYMPTTNQPVRISAQQRLLGQVANGDVARVVYHYDYSASSLSSETFNGENCKRLELKPKTKEAAYGKIILWVDNDNSQPRKAQFYAPTGKLLKTATYGGYRTVLGKQRPMTVVIEDELRDGEKTVMEMSDFKNETLPESSFRKDNLKYVR